METVTVIHLITRDEEVTSTNRVIGRSVYETAVLHENSVLTCSIIGLCFHFVFPSPLSWSHLHIDDGGRGFGIRAITAVIFYTDLICTPGIVSSSPRPTPTGLEITHR